jgi:hypothetical protein
MNDFKLKRKYGDRADWLRVVQRGSEICSL